jgi:hypothetical protein
MIFDEKIPLEGVFWKMLARPLKGKNRHSQMNPKVKEV